jgi:4-alpha-glucanotransferase
MAARRTKLNESALRRLAAKAGILGAYVDVEGKRHATADATRRSLLSAMGYDASPAGCRAGLAAHDRESWLRPLPSVHVTPAHGRVRVPVVLPDAGRPQILAWQWADADGRVATGQVPWRRLPLRGSRTIGGKRYQRRMLSLPRPAAPGTYRLRIDDDAARGVPQGLPAETLVIAVPRRCFDGAANRRLWGISVQLYGLRSAGNWGIGDFGDLARFAERAAGLGADFVGVSPLHALFPGTPLHACPYAPSSRRFLNVLHIDLDAVPESRTGKAFARMRDSGETQARLQALRAAELVDYAGVAAVKLPALDALFQDFEGRHLGAVPTPRGQTFLDFCAAQGEPLRRHATFDALQARMAAENPTRFGWPDWPERLHDPAGPAVRAFQKRHAARVRFYSWLQWLAQTQLAAAQDRAKAAGMRIGLYLDLAVGSHPAGSDVWANRRLFCAGASIGAPPDVYNARGQRWGLAPPTPTAMAADGYDTFARQLHAAMAPAGAVRIDHAMALQRLYWVPDGAEPVDGAYLGYPVADLIGVVALESQRAGAIVIGEDLGTLPPGFQPKLAASRIYSYRVLWFEKTARGRPKPAAQYPGQALVTGSTHDLPTLAGFFGGRDVSLRADLGMLPEGNTRSDALAERAAEVEALCRTIGLRAVPPDTPDGRAAFTKAAYGFLATTRSRLLVVQAEDALGLLEQANLPGTVDEHPNWRRRLPVDVDDCFADAGVRALLAHIDRRRRRRVRRRS